MGHFIMSSKEMARPGLVRAALDGKICNREGARALGMCARQFRRLKAAYRERGPGALVHGNRGRPSSRRTDPGILDRVNALIRLKYGGFNDCHLTEKLREVEEITISREKVRQLRQERGEPAQRKRRAPVHRSRRLREASAGSLVLIDGSDHLWFEDRGSRRTLIGAQDDATGEILALVFRPTEDLHGYCQLLRCVAETHGLPVNLYGDHSGILVRNDDHWSVKEQLEGSQAPTQFGRMLADLGVGFIAAHSPQAKGRIERLWETLQDRLVAEFRLRGISSVEAAEAFLPTFIADFNHRFARPARTHTSAWRLPPRNLDRILACRYERKVARDNTATIPGRWIQLPARGRDRSRHGRTVQLRELLDGRLLAFADGQLIASQPAPPSPFTLLPRHGMARRQRAGLLPMPKPTPPTNQQILSCKPGPRQAKPAPNHPWRTSPAVLQVTH
jgi:hypothetical protein